VLSEAEKPPGEAWWRAESEALKGPKRAEKARSAVLTSDGVAGAC
jgi:hypothetical protein